MGANQSGREGFYFGNKDVNFDHFHILRAIGKGSFGKVCIVQKKDTKQMFAMKYMNKAACIERDALRNVLREVELLTQLEHPLLVNLWFSFQDEEDLFMVTDLLVGGDLRYHIQHQVSFSKNSVILMVYEIASALDYLHKKRILHRDIKPDNILLDEEERDKILKYMDLAHEIKDMWRTPATIIVPIVISTNGLISKSLHANLCKVCVDGGLKYLMQKAVLLSTCRTLRHAHITDFNIATQLGETELATSMSGTKPYMSPEIFDCAADICVGYSYPVDWWSLGIVAFETMFGERPYDIHSHTGISEVRQLFITPLKLPHGTDKQLAELLKRLLCVSPGGRCSSMEELKKIPAMSTYDYEMVFQKRYKPEFCPPKDHLNCDPTFELEEMIVETKPLHKKKKRLAKQKSMREMQVGSVDLESQNSPTLEPALTNSIPEFITYNRYIELEKREIERLKLERQIKEEEWEKELATAMGESALSDKKEESDEKKKERGQDGCDILGVSESVHCLSKSKSEDDKCGKGCTTTISENCVCGDDKNSCKCSSSSGKCSDKKDNMENKNYSISHNDILAIKKKHSKLFFDMGMFSLKQKSKSFSRSNSLRTSAEKEILPEPISKIHDRKTDISESVRQKLVNIEQLDSSELNSSSQNSSTLVKESEYCLANKEILQANQT